MNKFTLILILILSASIGAVAQKKAQSEQIQANTSLQAQLQQNLDVKNAKVGDEVILKTSRAVKQNGETVIAKGTNIIGRITEVQKKSKNNAGSRLSVVFNRLQNGTPINASVVSIFQATGSAGAGDKVDSDILGSSNSSGSVSRGNSGGGLLGGVGNTVGGTVGGVTNTVGNTVGTVGSTVGGTTQTLGQTVNGIQITQSAGISAGSSTILSSDNRDLKLEKGVTFNLMVNESAKVN